MSLRDPREEMAEERALAQREMAERECVICGEPREPHRSTCSNQLCIREEATV